MSVPVSFRYAHNDGRIETVRFRTPDPDRLHRRPHIAASWWDARHTTDDGVHVYQQSYPPRPWPGVRWMPTKLEEARRRHG